MYKYFNHVNYWKVTEMYTENRARGPNGTEREARQSNRAPLTC